MVNKIFVGRIDGEIFETSRKEEHYFRKFEGFGISNNVLKKVLEEGCEIIKIIYTTKQGKKIYHCPIGMFVYSLIEWKDNTLGEIDMQKIVPIKRIQRYMDKVGGINNESNN